MLSLERIRAAARRAAPHVNRTPLQPVGDVHLKLECLQPTGSFKVRGFFAAALAASEQDLRRGLLTVSSGNAAQACAYVARMLDVPCRVVMFDSAPRLKVDGVLRWGAEVLPMPRQQMLDWMGEEAWTREPELFIHPYADLEVMAGHGGAALEILEDLPDLERVLVPAGGGGLVCGVAAAVKAVRPEIEVIAVQSEGYPLWPAAIEAGGPVSIPPQTIADGTTAPFSRQMFDALRASVDRWLLVPEPRLRSAIAEIASAAKVVSEGAGALAYAAAEQLEPGSVTAAIVSGGNIDPKLLSELLTAN